MSALNHIPTVLILSQDAFYKQHTEEEIQQAYNNDFDFGELPDPASVTDHRPPKLYRHGAVRRGTNYTGPMKS